MKYDVQDVINSLTEQVVGLVSQCAMKDATVKAYMRKIEELENKIMEIEIENKGIGDENGN